MNISFQHDDWGQLLVRLPGEAQAVPVEPVRSFPLTHPRELIALLDNEGREVLRIGSLDELDPQQRTILEQELSAREFSPTILRIMRTKPSSTPCQWDVETDRGRTQFEVDSDDDFRRLPDGVVIICDANGIRYRIPDPERLDPASRAILRRFL